MTGFGRCEATERFKKVHSGTKERESSLSRCEYPDAEETEFFETAIRTLLKSYANRGKVDIFITYEDLSQAQCQ